MVPGTVLGISHGALVVACGDDAVAIRQIQAPAAGVCQCQTMQEDTHWPEKFDEAGA